VSMFSNALGIQNKGTSVSLYRTTLTPQLPIGVSPISSPVYGELLLRRATWHETLLHPFLYVIDSKQALSFGEAQPLDRYALWPGKFRFPVRSGSAAFSQIWLARLSEWSQPSSTLCPLRRDVVATPAIAQIQADGQRPTLQISSKGK